FLDVSDLSNIAIGAFTPGAFDWATFDETSGVLGLKLNSAFHIAGDFDGDGKLTAADIAAMMKALSDVTGYETAHGLTDLDMLSVGDVDGSGTFTNADLQALMNVLAGAPGGGSLSAVPEPAGVVLALVGAAGIMIAARQRARA